MYQVWKMYYLVRKCYEFKKCRKCIVWSGSVMNLRSVENVLFGQEVLKCIIWSGSFKM